MNNPTDFWQFVGIFAIAALVMRMIYLATSEKDPLLNEQGEEISVQEFMDIYEEDDKFEQLKAKNNKL